MAPSPRPAAEPPAAPAGAWRWLPGLWVLRHYRRAWLGHDVMAGLVLTALLVPAGMGYAEAAGLPPVTGLYATAIPLLAYAVFGPSRIMVVGPDSGLAAMIAAAVAPLAHGDPARAVALASLLALLAGAVSVAAGLAGAGAITELLSRPVRVGFMNGLGLTVLAHQLPRLCGVAGGAGGVPGELAALARGLAAGEARPTALALGGGCLAVIVALRAAWPRAPAVLIAVALASAAAAWLGVPAAERIAAVPRGLVAPALPAVSLDDLAALTVTAVGIATVAFADTSVLSRSLASRRGERVDPSRELVALGLVNVLGGLFQGFPVSSSASRTPVAESAGARTQLTGVVGALAIAAILVAAPGLFEVVPTAALAAVVVAAALRMFDLGALRAFHRVRRADFVLSLVAFAGVAWLGALEGVALAVAVSLLDFVRRAWRPHSALLGRAPGVHGFHDVTRYPDARQVPGLLLFRWDAPLFFANAELFADAVLAAIEAAPAPARWVVIAAEPITDVDTTAAEALAALDATLAARGIELAFAELKDPVVDRLRRYGLHAAIGREAFFPTVGAAVGAYLARNHVAWAGPDEGRPPAP